MEDLFLNMMQTSLTVSGVIAVLLLLRSLLHRRYHARAMCMIWLVLAIRLLIPMQITFPQTPLIITPHTYRMESDAGVIHAQPQIERVTYAAAQDKESQAQAARHLYHSLSVCTVLSLIWFIGMLAMLLFRCITYYLFRKQLRRYSYIAENPALIGVFERERERLYVRACISLRINPLAGCPMLTGFVHKELILPSEKISLCDAAFVFRHELTHFRHGDLRLKAMLVLAQCVHWFNPLLYLTVRYASQDIEMACDRAVVQGLSLEEKKGYGETILNSVSMQTSRRHDVLVSQFSGNKVSLMGRLQNIFDSSVKKKGNVLLLTVLVLVTVLGGSFAIRQDASAAGENATLRQQLTEQADRWGDAFQHRNGKPIHALLTQDLAVAFYQEQLQTLSEIDPDGKLKGEDREKALWNIGVSSPWINGYTVQSVDEEKMQATLVYNWHASGIPDYRTAERLTFQRQNGALKVVECGNDYVPGSQALGSDVDSVAQFELLYGNDLGLPDSAFLYTAAENGGNVGYNPIDPFQSAENLLHLTGGKILDSRNYFAADKIAGKTISYQFADNGIINIDMINVYDMAYIPMNWSLPDGTNKRTANDLAQQWARGIQYKRGQYIYPILSDAEKKAFVLEHQRLADDGNWYWKVGGSSPSFGGWVVTDTNDPNVKRIVFLAYGGGVDDYRSSEGGYVMDITIGTEKRCAAITLQEAFDTGTLTDMERFRLLFGTGLPLPTYPEDELNYYIEQDTSYYFLQDPKESALTLFGLQNETGTVAVKKTATDTVKTVICSFDDGSGSVKIDMYQPKGYPLWLPLRWEMVLETPEMQGNAQK